MYETRRFGFAYSFLGIAVMSDWEGDDSYLAYTGIGGGHTHAKASWPGTLVTLRDWRGNDTYQAAHLSYASVLGDGTALLLDDGGTDAYHLEQHGLSFGTRYTSGGGILEHPVGRSPAYFLDGNGDDNYALETTVDQIDPGPVGNDLVDLRDKPWGIFLDCQTPAEAVFPCEHKQAEVLQGMIETA